MSIGRVSIEGNTLRVELGEMEAKILSRAWVFAQPLLKILLLYANEFILALASLEREQSRELVERIRRGEDISQIPPLVSIDTQNLVRKIKEVDWPTDEELFKALEWTGEL